MAKHKIILVSVVCFSVALANQRSLHMPPLLPPPKPGMTKEEYHKEFEKAFKQQRKQLREIDKEYMNLMARQAWMQLLRVSERQWKIIEPKYRKVNKLIWGSWIGAAGWKGQSELGFRWFSRTKGDGYFEAKALEEMTEYQRIAEDLIDLLEDEKSTDEQIRKKIDALQQAREKAREALPQARRELAEALTTPHQEAIFLIMGYID